MNIFDDNELVLLDSGAFDLVGGGGIYRPIPIIPTPFPITRWWLRLHRRYL